MPGKPQVVQHEGSWVTFLVSPTGSLVAQWGPNGNENWQELTAADTFEPNADVTVARVVPGPHDNLFYGWYAVAAKRPDGWAVTSMYFRSDKDANGNYQWTKATHWEGPFAAG